MTFKLPGHDNKNEPIERDILEGVDRVISRVRSCLLGVQALENLELVGGCGTRNEPENDW
jgi:hypothetical protein